MLIGHIVNCDSFKVDQISWEQDLVSEMLAMEAFVITYDANMYAYTCSHV